MGHIIILMDFRINGDLISHDFVYCRTCLYLTFLRTSREDMPQ